LWGIVHNGKIWRTSGKLGQWEKLPNGQEWKNWHTETEIGTGNGTLELERKWEMGKWVKTL